MSIAQDTDRAIYTEGIREGLVEFPTPCPDWCEEQHLLQHRLPFDRGGGRLHTRSFGHWVHVGAIEHLSAPGVLCSIEAEVDADLRSRTGWSPEQLRGLSRDAEEAALWVAAHQIAAGEREGV